MMREISKVHNRKAMLRRDSQLVNNNQNSFDPGTFHTIRHINKSELHRTDLCNKGMQQSENKNKITNPATVGVDIL